MMIYSGGELSVGLLPFFATCAELNEGGGHSTLEHNNTSWFQFWRACRIYSSIKWKVHNLGDITISCFFHCVTQLKHCTLDKLSSSIFCCLRGCEGSVTPNRISTCFNIYSHESPIVTIYHQIPSSTNLGKLSKTF